MYYFNGFLCGFISVFTVGCITASPPADLYKAMTHTEKMSYGTALLAGGIVGGVSLAAAVIIGLVCTRMYI